MAAELGQAETVEQHDAAERAEERGKEPSHEEEQPPSGAHLVPELKTQQVELGTEVTLVWGEEGGGSAKPVVERHRQVEIRAIVSPAPFSVVARTTYAEGWRTKAAVTG